MAFRLNFIIFLVLTFTFNITEFECGKINKKNSGKNKTLSGPPTLMSLTDFPLGVSDVFNDASGVFKKIIGRMVAKKRLVGLDSGWYW